MRPNQEFKNLLRGLGYTANSYASGDYVCIKFTATSTLTTSNNFNVRYTSFTPGSVILSYLYPDNGYNVIDYSPTNIILNNNPGTSGNDIVISVLNVGSNLTIGQSYWLVLYIQYSIELYNGSGVNRTTYLNRTSMGSTTYYVKDDTIMTIT